MTPEQFAYWLQGMLEGTDPKTLDEKQVEMIKEHLKTVFTKVTFTKIPSIPAGNKPLNPSILPHLRREGSDISEPVQFICMISEPTRFC